MADLIVTFRKDRAPGRQTGMPLARGSGSRTEAVAIGATNAVSELSAAAGEHFVKLRAGAACWFAVGAEPVAAAVASGADGTSDYLAADETAEFYIDPGEKVAVIQA